VTNRYFDVIVIVPLDEEFEAALDLFSIEESLTTPTQLRFAAKGQDSDLSILLVKQIKSGKNENQIAILAALEDYNCGVLVCMGIAGGLSGDLNIGDVCYTGSIYDLLDNARTTDTKDAKAEMAFSPTYYESPLEITVALSVDRFDPESRPKHIQWMVEREAFGKSLIPNEFTGKDGKKEKIGPLNIREGALACAAVSDSVEYNKKIRAIDRKMLAIETESGGLFSIAKLKKIPAFTIRGISDYAGFGIDKKQFEAETNNKARLLAALNAGSYLARQLTNPQLRDYIVAQRGRTTDREGMTLSRPANLLGRSILDQAERFDSKLRDLAPIYALKVKGYKIPVPRVRILAARLGAPATAITGPVDIRDAIRQARVLVIQIPSQYPDYSLSWIIAKDLLLVQQNDKQLFPSVIEGKDIRPPKNGFRDLTSDAVSLTDKNANTQLVIIVDEFDFKSKTRTSYLVQEILSLPNAKIIITTRNRSNILLENEFGGKTAASVAALCDVSFTEIASFLQKNFEMAIPEAQVVAIRLRDTFQHYKLPVHPTYFAGIPEATLTALLNANRRAELIEIAVVGYLSYVVSTDDQPVALSRTTREKFLMLVAFELNVEKRTFTEPELVKYADDFAKKYDFQISPSRFVSSFISKGILHIDGDRTPLACVSWCPSDMVVPTRSE
jgi:nucleoside phosphorylase